MAGGAETLILTWDRELQRAVQEAVIRAQASGSIPSAAALKVPHGRLSVTDHELAAVVAGHRLLGDLRMGTGTVHISAAGRAEAPRAPDGALSA